MRNSNTCRRGPPVKWLAALCLVANAFAVDPNRAVSQFIRDRWGPEKGLSGGPVSAIAQTTDGYLWIATESGLVRFNGLSFDSPAEQPSQILGLMTDAEGTLWLRQRGLNLSLYRKGAFENVMPGLRAPANGVTVMLRTGQQLIFATGWSGVKSLQNNQLETVVPIQNLPRSPVISLAKDSNGDLWIGTRDEGLLHAQAGKTALITKGLPNLKINCLLAGQNGELLIGTDSGMARWNGSRIDRLNHIPALAMIRDRDANVWIAAGIQGLYRLNENGLQRIDPLPGESVTVVFEDREGNIWSGSTNGIERLRDSVFSTYSKAEGMPSDSNGPVYADTQNRLWFAPVEGGLYSRTKGKIETTMPLGADVVYSIAGNAQGELWLGRQRGGLTHIGPTGSKTYTKVDGLAQNSVFAVALSRDGTVWAGTLNGGVTRFLNGQFTTYTTAEGLVSNTISAIQEDRNGSMWFATPNGISQLLNGHWKTYESKDGLPSDNVNCLFEDAKGVLWAGTMEGLASFQAGRFQAHTATRQPVFGIAQDKAGSLWVTTERQVLRISQNQVREYQSSDGLRSRAGMKRQRSVVADGTGKVWLSMTRGLSVVDTSRLQGRAMAPVVHIQSISADGNTLAQPQDGAVRVPAGSQTVKLSYEGLSLSIPERTRYRYRLEGNDHGWSEPLYAREANFSNLGPGQYRFRVIASDQDEVFNSAEGSLVFEVEPLFWQRLSVQIAAAIAFALAVFGGARMRMHQLAAQMRVRFEERTRIAGELHDTLLQTVQASKMIADNARENDLADTASLRESIANISDWLAQATTEARTALNSLRTPVQEKSDLQEAFRHAAQSSNPDAAMRIILSEEGESRDIQPLVRDEVYRIGCEAIRNACKHSQASELEVILRYARHFTIIVRDNGKGMDAAMLAQGKPGHFGLRGMQERASRIGGTLHVRSRPKSGTEIELTVPAKIVFAKGKLQ